VTDDTCGYETADGTPCEHRATEPDDRCWQHTDSGDADTGGRDFAVSESDHDDLLTAAREGFSMVGCARAVGVSETALSNYLDAHDEFKRAFTRARHEGERTLVRGPLIDDESTPDIDGQHARFLLSTSFDYIKTERTELSGGGGDDLQIETEVTTVTFEDD